MSLSFRKYEGLGNDFIVVDVAHERELDAARALTLCDRHFGVGADGVLLVLPAEPPASARMLVWNADGSRPEMCGNGLRCVALHLALTRSLDETSLVVATDAGPRRCDVTRKGGTAMVTIDMGVAAVAPDHITHFEGDQLALKRISVGNPHAVLLDSELSAADLDRLGPQVSSELPSGSNVEVVRVLGPTRLRVLVWERGVGRTLSCGTGAAAAAVVASMSGTCPFGEPLDVELPGGRLELRVQERSLSVSLRGPARWVFSGQVVTDG